MIERPAALTGLAIVGGTGLVFIAWDELASLSFEPTDAANFRAWANQPVGSAGGIAVACCVLGLVIWFVSRRHPRLLALAGVAVLVGAGALVWGPVAHAGRSHPEYARARTLEGLQMPSGYSSEAIRLVHPSAIDAPAATRTWTTAVPVAHACSDLRAAIESWADGGSVRTLGFANVNRCYISARKGGHPVDVNVISAEGTQQSVVSVSLGW